MLKTMQLTLLTLLTFLTLATANAQQATPPVASDPEKRMGGEKVLSLQDGPLLNPLCRFDDHPWFEIVNLRPGGNLRDALEMDFVCGGPLAGTFHVVVNTKGRQLRFPISATLLNQRRGLITCSYNALQDKTEIGADVEAYIEFTDAGPPIRQPYYGTPIPVDPLYFKVSRSAVRGNVPTVTYARELRPNELRIYELRKKKYGPPPPPPEGFTLAERTITLVPGTPILAAFEGDWLKAEVLSVSRESADPRITVHWPQFGHTHNKWHPTSAIAVERDIVARLLSDPASFQPSVLIPEGALQPPRPDEILLTEDITLVPGTPVSIYVGGSGWEYRVINADAEKVTAIRKLHGTRDEQFRRAQVTVHKDVLAQLKLPKAVETFAAELTAMRKATRKQSHRSYPIRIELPDGFVRVTETTPLKPGMTCKVSWGNQWDDVEIKSTPEDGGVEIHWPKWRSDYVVTLDSLIVSDATMGEKAMDADVAHATAVDGQTFRINLTETTKSKVPVIKLIMELTDVDLPTAKEILDFTPILVKSGLSKSEAAEWQKKFEAAGAVVTVEPNKGK